MEVMINKNTVQLRGTCHISNACLDGEEVMLDCCFVVHCTRGSGICPGGNKRPQHPRKYLGRKHKSSNLGQRMWHEFRIQQVGGSGWWCSKVISKLGGGCSKHATNEKRELGEG